MSRIKKAMEKAKKLRELGDYRPFEVVENRPTLIDRPQKELEPVSEEINPAYCRTGVFEIDPLVLRKNKIVSLFLEEAMTDQLKILRTKVMNKMEQIGGNSLLVTSANPQEGKTLTAINLAVSISHKVDHTVLLVDANLRTPSIHHYFGLDIDKGLSDYLLLQADLPDLLLNPGIDKLVILPAGKPLPNSADLLGAPRMESLVREMKARYSNRFIIFDSPSLLYSADPLVCSRFTDAILMVVESEKSSTKDLEQVCELLKDRVLIGSVLNKAKH